MLSESKLTQTTHKSSGVNHCCTKQAARSNDTESSCNNNNEIITKSSAMDYNDGLEAPTSPCLMSCLQTFGNMIFPGDRHFDQVCRMLLVQFRDTIFASLYCCDMNCGIKFEGGAGHDCELICSFPAILTDNQFRSKC